MIFIPHRSKPFTELNLRTFMDGKRGEFPGQQLHDVLEEYRDGIVWRILGWQESQLYHLLVAEDLLEVLVLFHDTLVVFILKPIAPSLVQFLIELCVELVIVDGTRIVDLVGIDADKAAGACGVSQWAQIIRRGNERCEIVIFIVFLFGMILPTKVHHFEAICKSSPENLVKSPQKVVDKIYPPP